MNTPRPLADLEVGVICNAGLQTSKPHRGLEQPARIALLRAAVRLLALVIWLAMSGQSRAEDPFVLWATMGPLQPYTRSFVLGPTGNLHVTDTPRVGQPANSDERTYNPSGTLVSSNWWPGVYVGRITFDSNGNKYLTGRIDTNGLFHISQARGFFVAKYSPTAQLLWVRSQAEAPSQWLWNRGDAIAVDSQGNVYVGGPSQGPMTLGQVSFGDGQGPLLCKYDSSGQLLWAKRVECSNPDEGGGGVNDLSVDPSGHIAVCGLLWEGSADFGGLTVYPGSTGHAYGGDFYVARFKPNGDVDWVQLTYGTSVAADKNGDIYATFLWTKDFGAEGLVKFNPNGDVLWSRNLTNAVVARSGGLTLDANDEPVFTGRFYDPATFGNITLRARSPGWEDLFVAKADAQGTIQWAIGGGGIEYDVGDMVTCDSRGNLFLSGFCRGSVGSFGGWPLIPKSGLNGEATHFVAKIAQKPPLQLVRSNQNVTLSWPVGATNYVLEAATSLPAISWATVTNTPTVSGRDRSVQLPLTGPAQFFRLRRP